MEPWLDKLLEHELQYARMAAECEKTSEAWYLTAPALPDYHDANRAIRLREDGRGPHAIAREVIAYFRARDLQPVMDVDPIAEEQGIGPALRRLGAMPVMGDRVLMRGPAEILPVRVSPEVTILPVPNETGCGEAAEWIETTISDDIGLPDEALWRAVAEAEARYTACRLYLGMLGGRPAGTCDLFSYHGWGRIDSVVTRPEFRRQGVASALVSQAAADSVTYGNRETYLFTEAGGDAERLYRKLGFERWHLNILRRHQV